MEGPSLFLAAEQLAPLVKKRILHAGGNTKLGKERLLNKKICAIFSWGKHLVFQFEEFAIRVHFMLWGSFEATINGVKVTGDYPKKNRIPRLALSFVNGHIEMYSCSLRFIENSHAKDEYDFSIDTMSSEWDAQKAIKKIDARSDEEIADVLLDQEVCAGVGNIIKNEVLFLTAILPTTPVKNLSKRKLNQLMQTVREYVFNFYRWRKNFELKKHYQIYRQSTCPKCGGKVTKKKTGQRNRFSYFCLKCQKNSIRSKV